MGGHFTWTGPRDLRLLSEKALALVKDEQERQDQTVERLRAVVDCLRHQIATNEPLATGEPSNLQVATLWDAKGVTAEHVYILGVCQQALPGQRRGEYPGTDAEYRDEQRRLFYVSIASQEDAGHFEGSACRPGRREAAWSDDDDRKQVLGGPRYVAVPS